MKETETRLKAKRAVNKMERRSLMAKSLLAGTSLLLTAGGSRAQGSFDQHAAKSRSRRMQEAVDRMEIEDCLYRYARGIDRHDPELTMTAYHTDALDDHGFFVGPAREFAKRAPRAHARFAAHQHYVMNHHIELDGDIAHGETYWMMVSRSRNNNQVDASGGRYIDRFERRDGVWAIAARVCIIDWSRDPENFARILSAFQQGSQDKSDLSYRRPLKVERPYRNEIPAFQLPEENAPPKS